MNNEIYATIKIRKETLKKIKHYAVNNDLTIISTIDKAMREFFNKNNETNGIKK